jgi:hypothetical protein
VEQLARVVPLVERLGDVDALVALQPDQLTAGDERERSGELGLSRARLTLQEQRPRHRARRETRPSPEPLVSEVVLLEESRLQCERRRQLGSLGRAETVGRSKAGLGERSASEHASEVSTVLARGTVVRDRLGALVGKPPRHRDLSPR